MEEPKTTTKKDRYYAGGAHSPYVTRTYSIAISGITWSIVGLLFLWGFYYYSILVINYIFMEYPSFDVTEWPALLISLCDRYLGPRSTVTQIITLSITTIPYLCRVLFGAAEVHTVVGAFIFAHTIDPLNGADLSRFPYIFRLTAIKTQRNDNYENDEDAFLRSKPVTFVIQGLSLLSLVAQITVIAFLLWFVAAYYLPCGSIIVPHVNARTEATDYILNFMLTRPLFAYIFILMLGAQQYFATTVNKRLQNSVKID